MARLDDLDLGDEDVAEPERTAAAAAEDLLAEIDDMLADDDFRWAEDTLSGIYDTVSRSGRATPRQVEAVENIRDGGHRRYS